MLCSRSSCAVLCAAGFGQIEHERFIALRTHEQMKTEICSPSRKCKMFVLYKRTSKSNLANIYRSSANAFKQVKAINTSTIDISLKGFGLFLHRFAKVFHGSGLKLDERFHFSCTNLSIFHLDHFSFLNSPALGRHKLKTELYLTCQIGDWLKQPMHKLRWLLTL